MLRGLYTAASGMLAEQRRHDTVTQNIANLNTPGYKQVNSVAHSFPEMLIALMGDKRSGSPAPIGKLVTGVFAEESLPAFVQGDLKETQKSTDFALVSSLSLDDPATGEPIAFDASGKYVGQDGTVTYQPQAFFAVADENGNVRYTRDGNFNVNAAGELRTSTGYRVLDDQGNAIVLAAGMSVDSLKSSAAGQLTTYDNNTGTTVPVAALGIVVADRPQQLVREGNGVYVAQDETAAGIRTFDPAADGASVRQGYLEVSNVDAAQSMVDLMAAQRAYESNQKIIQYYDKSLEKAVNEIGRV
ncbi:MULTISPECIES: flagellar hook-basal body protein [Paenibacillus]|uniref:Flagellar hook-basal body family protein n=1 Tax=Paenibacillus macerans TaxID=44252 RepID=A0A090XSJ1_PAEMA|nr:flagellar hook-basal body protein [Paenibacillus macerans]KFM89109.1 flagellar hook-basal body family protein [Paenibacillus macerans]MBS5911301.1 flagellar hook-basal body protein [Paenibacillus macerans]MCY7558054.1 flagellar hook-basal body protein [Paenibacillus macerans]MDU5946314.1 flagellar hook-basal body protein [Paenibacillus macerans]MEC0154138.1 flagellar hook-basal body protein [Paenibacillus macerans]